MLLLALAYAAISVALFSGRHDEPLLLILLAAGGLGLGLQFSALLSHLTTVVPVEYAADISGVSTTTISVGGVVGVAAVGTLYLDLTGAGAHATHAFAVTTAVLAGLAVLAAALSARATAVPARPR